MIRSAVIDDIPALTGIYSVLFSEAAALQPLFWKAAEQTREFLENAITKDGWEIFSAEEKGTLVGFALVQEQETPPYPCLKYHKFAYLMDMAVLPEYRKRGYGAELLDAVKEWGRGRNLDYIDLAVLEENDGARKLYEWHGFKPSMTTMRFMLK